MWAPRRRGSNHTRLFEPPPQVLTIGVCADYVENAPISLLQRGAANTSERVWTLALPTVRPDETSVHPEASVLSQLDCRLERQGPEPFRRRRQQFVVVCQSEKTGIIWGKRF